MRHDAQKIRRDAKSERLRMELGILTDAEKADVRKSIADFEAQLMTAQLNHKKEAQLGIFLFEEITWKNF